MQEEIRNLLKKRNAILLSHNYQPPEIQDLADLCGDSLELSIRASQTEADVIVFCGVHFMAETASILSPDKTVLLPRKDAGCPMADMVTPEALKARLETLPGVPVVTYVNSPASVKAMTTICCTSANAVKIVNSLPDEEVLMLPDKNLAQYTASRTDKKIHYWQGYCPIHNNVTVEQVEMAKAARPDAVFMAHPECPPEVLALADVILSTSGMIRHASESSAREFIVGTEVGILHPLQKENPDKAFYPAAESMVCLDMKKITLADLKNCLETLTPEVKVPEEIRVPALQSVQRMIEA